MYYTAQNNLERDRRKRGKLPVCINWNGHWMMMSIWRSRGLITVLFLVFKFGSHMVDEEMRARV